MKNLISVSYKYYGKDLFSFKCSTNKHYKIEMLLYNDACCVKLTEYGSSPWHNMTNRQEKKQRRVEKKNPAKLFTYFTCNRDDRLETSLFRHILLNGTDS